MSYAKQQIRLICEPMDPAAMLRLKAALDGSTSELSTTIALSELRELDEELGQPW